MSQDDAEIKERMAAIGERLAGRLSPGGWGVFNANAPDDMRWLLKCIAELRATAEKADAELCEAGSRDGTTPDRIAALRIAYGVALSEKAALEAKLKAYEEEG